MKSLAIQSESFGVETAKISLTRSEAYTRRKAKIDYWDPKGRKIACYFADGDPSVMIDRKLPPEPKIFALVHELKHHWVDRDAILDGVHNAERTTKIT